jgi:hypothetical protein
MLVRQLSILISEDRWRSDFIFFGLPALVLPQTRKKTLARELRKRQVTRTH